MRRPPILGMALALAGGLLLGLLIFRSATPPELTSTALDEARARWRARGPVSYELEVQMGGTLTDRRLISVRDGHVVGMTIDARAAAESSWEYWSVEGMLDFLEAELSNAAEPPPGLGITDPSLIVLRATFDAELGYPTHFFRHLMGRQQGTEWEVIRFDPGLATP